ncbi:MAG: enoyl-CoA hydratase [Proteobacteria bacterium]|nr:MAG: enoyl-CoA hydratase [Pseudomonadota bacterium]
MIDLERHDGGVCVLRMRDGENRFTNEFLGRFSAALDEVERSEGPAALVTTGDGKFWSNGLALDALAGRSAAEVGAYLREVHRLFARVLAFPRATVAAIGGHAFAGGAMLALAHDFRVMRADRGFVCLPEVDLRLPLQPGMTALIAARLPAQAAHEAIVTGRRYGGADALARGIVDEAVAEAEVLPRAIERARELAGKDPATLAALKRGLYAGALAVLEAPGV